MKPFPHHYEVSAACAPEGEVTLSSAGVEELKSSPPQEFDGPGDRWSPELLLLAALSDCFVLSFRAMAQASRFEWRSLDCRASGTLDRVDGRMRFTSIRLAARLALAAGAREDRAQRLLERAEKGCPIGSSLAVPVELETRIEVAPG
jgi:peroxiredoxin-like protein